MADCNECKAVPYIVHEASEARHERTFRRMWIVVIVLIVLLVGSNIAWLSYESQFETVEIKAEQEADGDSNNYAVGGDFYGFPTEGYN